MAFHLYVTVRQANLSFPVPREPRCLCSLFWRWILNSSLLSWLIQSVGHVLFTTFSLCSKPFRTPLAVLSLIYKKNLPVNHPVEYHVLSLQKLHCVFLMPRGGSGTSHPWPWHPTAFPGPNSNCRQMKVSQVCPWQGRSHDQTSTVQRKLREALDRGIASERP